MDNRRKTSWGQWTEWNTKVKLRHSPYPLPSSVHPYPSLSSSPSPSSCCTAPRSQPAHTAHVHPGNTTDEKHSLLTLLNNNSEKQIISQLKQTYLPLLRCQFVDNISDEQCCLQQWYRPTTGTQHKQWKYNSSFQPSSLRGLEMCFICCYANSGRGQWAS